MSTDRMDRSSDGPIPRGWILAAAGTVLFAVGYWLWFQAFQVEPGPLGALVAAQTAALDNGEPVTEEMLDKLAANPLVVQAGAGTFAMNCTRCHGQRAEGKIGPNLTDDFWIGGGSAVNIYQTILHGRDGKGMPAWGPLLGGGACTQVAAYVLTLRGTHLPGKAPEGEKWTPPAPAPPDKAPAPAPAKDP